jgi:hypothetical protein
MNNLCCCNLLLKFAIEDIGRGDDYKMAALAGYCKDMAGGEGACLMAEPGTLVADVPCTSCVGEESGTFCGALAAAIAILYLDKDSEEAEACQDEFMDWFADNFGGYDCDSIAQNLDILKDELCPKVILQTYLHLRTHIKPDNHLSQKTLI